MKNKHMRSIIAVLLVCTMALAMTACAFGLKGTYTNTDGLVEQSFTFMEDNKVKMSAFGIDVEATYEIDGDTIILTYSLLSLSYDMEKSFSKQGNSIFIDGVEFVKQS